MNSVGKTAQQTDDWQQNKDDVLRQSQRHTAAQGCHLEGWNRVICDFNFFPERVLRKPQTTNLWSPN